MGLDLVPWDPGIECPLCSEWRPHPEKHCSGPPGRSLAGKTERRRGRHAGGRIGEALLLGGAVVIITAVLIADRIGLLRWP
jgi:hypothetical protein